MKKLIVSIVLVLAVALVTVACESAPTKNDGTTRKNEVEAPDWLIHQGLEGRICGIGITPDNDPKLAEDMGRLELARKVVSLGMSLGTIFAELENGEAQKTKSEQEQNAPISEDEQNAKKELFITKSFNKIDVFGEWKSAGKIYKLMCLLTEEEIQKRIDNMLTKEENTSLDKHGCLYRNERYIWPVKNKIYPSREDFVAGDDTDGFISSGFGDDRNHTGIDLALKNGTPVYATASGIVTFAGCDSRCSEICDDKCDKGYGKYIIISHPDGMRTLYAHLQEFKYLRGSRKDSLRDDFIVKMSMEIEQHSLKDASVQELKKGDCVKQGDQIGLVGHTGVAESAADGTGSHLHFEIRKYSNPVDPIHYLPDLSLKLVQESGISEKAEKVIMEDLKKGIIEEKKELNVPEETDDKKAPEEQKE